MFLSSTISSLLSAENMSDNRLTSAHDVDVRRGVQVSSDRVEPVSLHAFAPVEFDWEVKERQYRE
jgi:hypothetical protein